MADTGDIAGPSGLFNVQDTKVRPDWLLLIEGTPPVTHSVAVLSDPGNPGALLLEGALLKLGTVPRAHLQK